jgi:hypothetical protein
MRRVADKEISKKKKKKNNQRRKNKGTHTTEVDKAQEEFGVE